ncbi:unnamed protein product [Pleuronectes platessa]|uniref:Uncharacterized protein n=1 Tax=Pleuronectes platessa TaxID=8262 RepID=A0A9N7VU60_PLEPL|nr:unnamed protein product [Pleuronectes platessa]
MIQALNNTPDYLNLSLSVPKCKDPTWTALRTRQLRVPQFLAAVSTAPGPRPLSSGASLATTQQAAMKTQDQSRPAGTLIHMNKTEGGRSLSEPSFSSSHFPLIQRLDERRAEKEGG